ncbi:hypothetical protein BKA66DRAFT_438745 [Pyrenochaeta sp. MPI-SDFR-AT-0127]|nr:hypothetical protein BKA66DRAFT_438745 [Pyrenochaeta sp. MPI-SDFR-AT-0127]
MCEPFSAGAIFASVGSAFKFADLAVRIAEVGSENEVFVRTIHVVRDDLNEVERLLKAASVQRKLASTPGKLPWVRSAINNTKSALNEIGKWVERARAEQQSTGSIQFNTRVRWVFNDHEKILNRKAELMTCHQQLSNVLSYLIRLEDVPTSTEPPTYQDTTYFDDIISRHNRKSVRAVPVNVHPDLTTPDANDISKSSSTLVVAPSLLNVTHSIPSGGYKQQEASNMDFNRQANIFETPMSPSLGDSCPSSPPPTYASAVHSTPNPRFPQTDDKRSYYATTLMQNPDQVFPAGKAIKQSYEAHSETKDAWAYQLAPNNSTVSELAGDTVALSATNAFGPVNPYEYCPTPPLSGPPSFSRKNETKPVVELLGDLNFAVELPSNDPGPPPGYPPRSNRRSTYGPGYPSLESNLHVYEQRRSIPELPAMPRRRPAPSHAYSEPLPTAHELPALLSASSINASSQRRSVVSMSQPSFAAVESQKLSERPSELPCSSWAESQRTFSKVSPSPIPSSPAYTLGSSIHTGSLYNDTQNTPQDSVKAVGMNVLPMSFKPPEPAESVSTTRMRRQKQMMDLLGSIGS